jgi:hypothetical protein
LNLNRVVRLSNPELLIITKDLAIQVFAISGLQRLAFEHPESPRPVGPSLGTQEHGFIHLSIREAAREFIEMRYVEDLDAFFE